MGKVLAGHYRYVKGEGDDAVRILLAPGDDLPSDFDSEEAKRLEKDGLLVDEKRLTDDGLRIPYGAPDREVEATTEYAGNAAGGAKRTAAKQTGKKEGDDS